MCPYVKESRATAGESSTRPARILVQLNFTAYPVQASLGSLGRKWALLVLMNIALSRAQRYNELLRSTPGMSKRILAMRLRELEADGFIFRAERDQSHTRWQLTQKGADVLPVLLTLIHFGSKRRDLSEATVSSDTAIGKSFKITYGLRRSPGRRRRSGP
jgi:DNA-binding HxlR family transcriptional regulator